jgi:hypothetical protein
MAAALMLGAWGLGCAPATMGPMIMRTGPIKADKFSAQLGMRTGPRLTSPLAARGTLGSFVGDRSRST